MTPIVITLIAFAMVAGMLLWKGYVLSILWDWFIVPVFHVSSIGIPLAIGITIVFNLLTNHNYRTEEGKEWEVIFKAFLGPLFLLGIGWVVKQFL